MSAMRKERLTACPWTGPSGMRIPEILRILSPVLSSSAIAAENPSAAFPRSSRSGIWKNTVSRNGSSVQETALNLCLISLKIGSDESYGGAEVMPIWTQNPHRPVAAASPGLPLFPRRKNDGWKKNCTSPVTMNVCRPDGRHGCFFGPVIRRAIDRRFVFYRASIAASSKLILRWLPP